jgi:hypothetical protein
VDCGVCRGVQPTADFVVAGKVVDRVA